MTRIYHRPAKLITMYPSNRFHHKTHIHGFTVIELVVTILLLGILAAYAAPRLNIAGFERQGYYQQAVAALRMAQKQAVAANCATQAVFTTTSCTIQKTGCAGSPFVTNPTTGSTNFCNDSQSSSISGSPIAFDKVGAGTGTLTIDGINVVVHANTGFIEAP